ncbi:hypothetical protein LXM94_21850 [Rhizobium sp. TRM95111]|uniref:hypothetical protein n=1 Tax=Rhizobium alarense TaxID=2846851 RepID=UPI001F24C423|nr:hypothetical protein [Rhizobium alarense]MCF3642620.1 hypothetical protein [Rhizobium alarense]
MTSRNTPFNRILRPTLVPALALALALPLAAGVSAPAGARDGGEDGPRIERRHDGDRGDRHGPRDRMDGDRMGPHRMGRFHRPPLAEMVAMKLAAAEQAAGIKTAQLDAWRTFSAALVDFVTMGRPGMGDPGMGDPDMGDLKMGDPKMGPPGAGQDDEAAAPDAAEAVPDGAAEATPPAGDEARMPGDGRRRDRSAFDMLDRMIARSEARAEKAAALKTALADLEAVLEPAQREKLDTLMLPGRPFRDGPGPRR